jgi:multisubunit Na+/H+ antiporter MnhF subunit
MIELHTALAVSMGLTILGLLAASVRLVLGPSRADRVVALDLITVLLVAIAAQLCLQFEEPAYLDLGLAIALIGFLATVAFARYIENAPQLPTPDGRRDDDGGSTKSEPPVSDTHGA